MEVGIRELLFYFVSIQLRGRFCDRILKDQLIINEYHE